MLIDDWVTGTDVFIEQQRLKDLFYYYDNDENEIEFIFQQNAEHHENEIASESLMNLGLINFQKALLAGTQDLCIKNLEISKSFFQKATEVIENQINAEYYGKLVSTLIELLNCRWGSANQYIKELANILFHKEAFSFNFQLDNLQFGFYQILGSFQKICNKKPTEWLDYRKELDNIFLHYYEIANASLKNRLNKTVISESFATLIKQKLIEPYFSLNLTSELTKINVRLREYDKGTKEHDFLLYLKSVLENSSKKKVELESIEQKFRSLFPNRNPASIKQVLDEAKNPLDYLSAFEAFSKISYEKLRDCLVFACVKLQGNKNYWGNKTDEDNRNKYIADLLEAQGFTVKDQTKWSVSAEGKGSGEIDIFITEKDGSPKSIIEALNLDSLKSDYLILHLDKVFKYDTTGLENNYIIAYSTAKKFINLWDKYKDFILIHKYTYDFQNFSEIDDYKYTDIKIGVAKHLRNGKLINLHHIMIDLKER